MVYKIIWTPTALESYVQLMEHLVKMWSEDKAAEFARHVEGRISTLSTHPYIGIRRSTKHELVRSIVLHKRMLLVYKIRPVKKEIELSLFWNTFQNPNSMQVN